MFKNQDDFVCYVTYFKTVKIIISCVRYLLIRVRENVVLFLPPESGKKAPLSPKSHGKLGNHFLNPCTNLLISEGLICVVCPSLLALKVLSVTKTNLTCYFHDFARLRDFKKKTPRNGIRGNKLKRRSWCWKGKLRD